MNLTKRQKYRRDNPVQPKKKYHKWQNYKFYKVIEKAFGKPNAIKKCSEQTGFSIYTIYNWIKRCGVYNKNSQDLLRYRGFDPETLEKIEK